MNRRSFLQFLGALAGSAALPAAAVSVAERIAPALAAPIAEVLPPASRLDLGSLLDACIKIVHPDLRVEYLQIGSVRINAPMESIMTARLTAFGPFQKAPCAIGAELDCSGDGNLPVSLRVGERAAPLMNFLLAEDRPVAVFHSIAGPVSKYRGQVEQRAELEFAIV